MYWSCPLVGNLQLSAPMTLKLKSELQLKLLALLDALAVTRSVGHRTTFLHNPSVNCNRKSAQYERQHFNRIRCSNLNRSSPSTHSFTFATQVHNGSRRRRDGIRLFQPYFTEQISTKTAVAGQIDFISYRGVPNNTKFNPKLRGEIADVQWFALADLPTKN